MSNEIVESKKLLDAVTVAGTGPVVSQVRRIKTFDAFVIGPGAVSATVVFEGSNTGAHWEPLGTVTLAGTGSASAPFYHDGPWAAIRATVTDISGGAVTAAMGY